MGLQVLLRLCAVYSRMSQHIFLQRNIFCVYMKRGNKRVRWDTPWCHNNLQVSLVYIYMGVVGGDITRLFVIIYLLICRVRYGNKNYIKIELTVDPIVHSLGEYFIHKCGVRGPKYIDI